METITTTGKAWKAGKKTLVLTLQKAAIEAMQIKEGDILEIEIKKVLKKEDYTLLEADWKGKKKEKTERAGITNEEDENIPDKEEVKIIESMHKRKLAKEQTIPSPPEPTGVKIRMRR